MKRKSYINGLFTIDKGNECLKNLNNNCFLLGYLFNPKLKSMQRLVYKCTLCGLVSYSTWGSLVHKKIPCVRCNKKLRETKRKQKLLGYIKNNTDGYQLISNNPIKTTETKVKLKHLCCGNTLTVSMHHFIDDEIRCTKCCKSSGEAIVKELLNINNIKYIQEYRFKDLSTGKLNNSKSLMPVDFYLPNKKVIIEYQGKQHFTYNNWNKGKDYLKEYKYHDNIKKQYANDNGYKLLTPDYNMNRKQIFKYLSNNLCKAE